MKPILLNIVTSGPEANVDHSSEHATLEEAMLAGEAMLDANPEKLASILDRTQARVYSYSKAEKKWV